MQRLVFATFPLKDRDTGRNKNVLFILPAGLLGPYLTLQSLSPSPYRRSRVLGISSRASPLRIPEPCALRRVLSYILIATQIYTPGLLCIRPLLTLETSRNLGQFLKTTLLRRERKSQTDVLTLSSHLTSN